MSLENLDRRQFQQLSSAALGGLLAGTMFGCGGGEKVAQASGEQHLCRGLNDCKGQGADAKNDCRGQGTCATVTAHSCHGENSCKGLGGCGDTAGANACKGQGGCSVPLMDSAWNTVRDRLVTKWKAADAKFGEAPAEKK